MRNVLLGVVLWLLSFAVWGNDSSAQKLSEVISQTDLLGASALAYFNTDQRSRDERSLTSAYSSLYTLEMCMAHQGQPAEQTQPLAQIKALLAQLEALPSAQRERYSELLSALLVEQKKLREAAASAFATSRAQLSNLTQTLSEQSHDLSRLHLDYQIRHAPKVAAAMPTLSVPEREALVAVIDQRFKVLQAELPEHSELLGKTNAQYRFVRSQLVSPDSRLQSGVEFYLSRVVLDLQELVILQSSEGQGI
jgi:uncharacterized protein (UPF0212 family)